MISRLGMNQATINQRLLFQNPNLENPNLRDEPTRSNCAEHGVELAIVSNVDSIGPSGALAHLVSLAVNLAIT